MTRVLFLDDEGVLVEYLPLVLQPMGLEVIGTTSIPDAMEKLKNEEFDLALVDIMMPVAEDMDADALDYGRRTGVEVIRRIRSARPALPIVAITIIMDDDLIRSAKNEGAVAVISKPAEPAHIAERLERVLTQTQKRG
jgi:CheY-like chemotaxis protein